MSYIYTDTIVITIFISIIGSICLYICIYFVYIRGKMQRFVKKMVDLIRVFESRAEESEKRCRHIEAECIRLKNEMIKWCEKFAQKYNRVV